MNLKTSIILGLTLTLLSIVSCSKSDSVDPINPSNIIAENTAKLIGSWEIENIITANCTDPNDNETLESGCETEEGSEVCLLGIQTFFQDNTFSLEYIMTSKLEFNKRVSTPSIKCSINFRYCKSRHTIHVNLKSYIIRSGS